MQRDAGPGDALHVGHRRAAVDVGGVPSLAADDGEDPRRRAMARHARRDLGTGDKATAVVDGDVLVGEGEDGEQRVVWCLLDDSGVLAPLALAVFVTLTPGGRGSAALLLGAALVVVGGAAAKPPVSLGPGGGG